MKEDIQNKKINKNRKIQENSNNSNKPLYFYLLYIEKVTDTCERRYGV